LNIYIDNVFNFPTYAESYRVAAINAQAKLEVSAGGRHRDVA